MTRVDPDPEHPPEPLHAPLAFATFYTDTVKRTHRVVLGLLRSDKDTAEDVVQDAYLEMLLRWHDRKHLALEYNRQYVTKIAMNKARDRCRQLRRFGKLDEELDCVTLDDRLDEVLDGLSILRHVRRVIAVQPERRRQVAVMHFLEERSPLEIADVLRISPSTVRTHLQRVRELLGPDVLELLRLQDGGECSD